MIVSHKHKFIFIHCRKVAGSSIKRALWPHLGSQDVIIGSLQEIAPNPSQLSWPQIKALISISGVKAFPKELAGHILGGRPLPHFWRNYINRAVKEYYIGRLGSAPEHASATLASHLFHKEWGEYYKFCFVRNSFDQAVSEYEFQRAKRSYQGSFLEFLVEVEVNRGCHISRDLHASNWGRYTIDDSVIVDKIGFFHSLEEDFSQIAEHLGLDVDLGKIHSKKNSGRKPFREYYGPEEIDRVTRIYTKEIKHFGWKL